MDEFEIILSEPDRTGTAVQSMIKIAIVDDEIHSIQKCENIIRKMKLPNVQVDTFEDSKMFHNAFFVNKEYFNIIILDIDMPVLNGFDIAKSICDLEINTIVLFYTAHDQYVFQAYEYQPFRYIRKELADKELPFALNAALQKIEKNEKNSIELKIDDERYFINLKDVMYIESENRKSCIYLKDDREIRTWKSIKELSDYFQDDCFYQIFNGIIVNFKYVKSYNQSYLTLSNKKKLMISRRKYADFKSKIACYLGSETI